MSLRSQRGVEGVTPSSATILRLVIVTSKQRRLKPVGGGNSQLQVQTLSSRLYAAMLGIGIQHQLKPDGPLGRAGSYPASGTTFTVTEGPIT